MDDIATWTYWSSLASLFSSGRVFAVLRALMVLGIAFLTTPVIRRTLIGVMEGRWSRQQIMLANRITTYLCYGVAAATGLRELGFEMTPLLGAAGIFSVAIGFASQTSFSNLISGMFLISEQAFVVGDSINVNSVVGEVLAIDLLSVKMRTNDNLLVRIPNETMLKSVVTNMSRFPIRRLDMEINVAYREDISHVKRVLYQVAEHNVLGLDDPKPIFVILGYGDSALRLQFSVWSKRENFIDLKNSMFDDVKVAFEKEKIDMPFPHRALVVGGSASAIAVNLMAEKETADAAPVAVPAPTPQA
jgi:small-conductance mechanosensitive channel